MQGSLNLAGFEKAWAVQETKETPFLRQQLEEFERTRPLEGLRILHNIPLSVDTVCKLHALAGSGAEVTVTATRCVAPKTQDLAIDILEEVGLSFQKEHKIDAPYDLYLDCAAELRHLPPPRLGIVELTGSGTDIYKQTDLSVPVVSVDDCGVKALETFFGTGDGFLRAFCELTGKDPTRSRFCVVGYGKVGQGIAYALKQAKGDVTVIDADADNIAKADKQGVKAVLAQDGNEALSQADVIVTATGVRECMTRYYDSELIRGKILANMGAEDEFGPAFDPTEVLGNKVPVNFLLDAPTQMRYLDPIFYTHNHAAVWIAQAKLAAGYHPYPDEFSREVLRRWSALHGEELCG